MKDIIIGTKGSDECRGIIYAPYLIAETIPSINWNSSKAEKEVIAVNRERKINSILDNIEFIPIKLEETEAYKNTLFKPSKMMSSRYQEFKIQ